jgi:nucleotide-binding universal stress UspA family protein
MFYHILVPLDGSPLAECVVPHVVAIANAFEARITLLNVLDRPTTAADAISTSQFVDPLAWHMGKAQAKNYLDGVIARLEATGVKAEDVLLDGQAAQVIIEYAHRQQVGLIVLSSHGHSGLSIWNVSGVVQKIIQRANLPAMIVRAYRQTGEEPQAFTYRKILVPLDLSQRAESALPLASRLAGYHHSTLLLAHVVPRPEMPRRMAPSAEDLELVERLVEGNRQEAEKYLSQLENRLASENVKVQTHLLIRENVASALQELAEQEKVDLVIMSAHGYSGETRWPYGNVVEKFIHYGSAPLLIYQDFKPEELQYSAAETVLSQIKGH